MKYLLHALTLLVFASCAFADLPPAMPELEAFIAKGEIVNELELKVRGAQIEQQLVIDSYRERLGLTQEQAREQFPEVIMFVGYLGGGKFDQKLYDRFVERRTFDSADLYLRHNAFFIAAGKDPDNAELLEQMRQNVLEMERQGYSMIRVCGAAYDYREKAEDKADPMKDDRFLIERVAHMVQTLEMDSQRRTYIFDKFVDPFIDTKDKDLRNAIIETFEASYDTDPWFLQMVHGVNQNRIAWEKRGTGYANTVSSEQFDAFHFHLDQSINHLRKAYEIDPGCPQTSNYMVKSVYPRTSMWRDEGWTWFERTLIACIDYEPIFQQMHHILQDKWHGDMTSRAEFAQWCARPDLAGTGIELRALYALERAWWTYGVDYKQYDYFWEAERAPIEAVIKAMQIRIDKALDPDLDYEHSILAFMRFRFDGDLEGSAAHIRACKNGINRNARRKMRFDDFNLASIVLPLTVPETAEIARVALGYEETGEFSTAADQWDRVMQILDEQGDTLALEAVRNRTQGDRWQSDYEARSGWVELGFDEFMSGWDQADGTWKRIDEHTVRSIMRGRDEETLLVADLETGNWYEVTATVRVIDDPTVNCTIGINFYRGSRKTDGWDQMRYISARYGRKLAAMGWNYAGNDYKIPIPDPNADGAYDIRLIVLDNQVTGYINGQLVGKGEVPNWKPEKEPEIMRIGLGAYLYGDAQAEFSNIRIRKRRPVETIEF